MQIQGNSLPTGNHSNEQIINKGQWNGKEIASLHEGVTLHGKRWTKVAQVVGTRLGKQCRERWINHEDPALKKTKWTKQEDQILIDQYKEKGSKWHQIAPFLTGRSQNDIKNHWNSTLKKTIGKMSRQQSKINIDREKEPASLKKHKMKDVQQQRSLKKIHQPSSSSPHSFLAEEETPKALEEQNQTQLNGEALSQPDIFSPLKLELDFSNLEFNTMMDLQDSVRISTPTDLFLTMLGHQNSDLNTSQSPLLQNPLTPKTPVWNPNFFDFTSFYV